MRIAITRPAEDAAPLKAKLEALGHDVIVTPLLTIVPRAKVAIPDLPWQAIVVTSANGIRALTNTDHLHSIRILTVGPQSLNAARAAGFRNAEAHGGDVDGLSTYIRGTLDPEDGPILYLSGAATAGDLEARLTEAGFACTRLVVYDAVPADSLGEAGSALAGGRIDAVLLYSPRTAHIWRLRIQAEGLEQAARQPHYLCLSRNVAAALPGDWRLHIAASPDEAAMLALLELISGTR